jgi:hypothetical protein
MLAGVEPPLVNAVATFEVGVVPEPRLITVEGYPDHIDQTATTTVTRNARDGLIKPVNHHEVGRPWAVSWPRIFFLLLVVTTT